MALVARVRITYEDAKGKSSSSKINIPISVSILAWLGFALQSGQLALNLSTCRITKIGVYSGIDISGIGIKAAPTLLSDVEQKGFFIFGVDGPSAQRHQMQIPAFNENFVLDNSDIIDVAATEVAAFITAMEDGFLTSTVRASNFRAYDVTDLKDAREVFRKRNRG